MPDRQERARPLLPERCRAGSHAARSWAAMTSSPSSTRATWLRGPPKPMSRTTLSSARLPPQPDGSRQAATPSCTTASSALGSWRSSSLARAWIRCTVGAAPDRGHLRRASACAGWTRLHRSRHHAPHVPTIRRRRPVSAAHPRQLRGRRRDGDADLRSLGRARSRGQGPPSPDRLRIAIWEADARRLPRVSRSSLPLARGPAADRKASDARLRSTRQWLGGAAPGPSIPVATAFDACAVSARQLRLVLLRTPTPAICDPDDGDWWTVSTSGPI